MTLLETLGIILVVMAVAFFADRQTKLRKQREVPGADESGRAKSAAVSASRSSSRFARNLRYLDDQYLKLSSSARRVNEKYLLDVVFAALTGGRIGLDEFARKEIEGRKDQWLNELKGELLVVDLSANVYFEDYDFEKNAFPVSVALELTGNRYSLNLRLVHPDQDDSNLGRYDASLKTALLFADAEEGRAFRRSSAYPQSALRPALCVARPRRAFSYNDEGSTNSVLVLEVHGIRLLSRETRSPLFPADA